MAKKKRKRIPEFESEEQEREFWAEHDSADYVDWSKADRATLANLKPPQHQDGLSRAEAESGTIGT